MDDFREWLSDNLRYFELGGAILLFVLLIAFGIRSCGKEKEPIPSPQTSASSGQGTDNSVSVDENSGDSTGSADANALKEADSDISTLIRNYYQALNNKDVATVRSLVDVLSPTDEPLISNSAYENYVVDKVYTKNGLTEDTKVVYVTCTYQVPRIATPIPSASWFYVYKDADGAWKINSNASTDSSISAYMNSLKTDPDVAALTAQVQKAYEDTLASNPSLASYLGVSVNSSGGSGTKMTATTDVNVRASASSDGDLLGMVSEGDTITKEGQEGDWIKITYDGQTAYVFGQYFEEVTG